MNNDIKFLDIEWRTPYPLTNFADRFGLRGSVIFRPQYVWFPVHLDREYTRNQPLSLKQISADLLSTGPSQT